MGRPQKRIWIVDYTADLTTTVEAETEDEAYELADANSVRHSAEILSIQLHSVTEQ